MIPVFIVFLAAFKTAVPLAGGALMIVIAIILQGVNYLHYPMLELQKACGGLFIVVGATLFYVAVAVMNQEEEIMVVRMTCLMPTSFGSLPDKSPTPLYSQSLHCHVTTTESCFPHILSKSGRETILRKFFGRLLRCGRLEIVISERRVRCYQENCTVKLYVRHLLKSGNLMCERHKDQLRTAQQS